MGERPWLDGFDGSNDSGVFFAASLRDHSIYLLKWKAKPRRDVSAGSEHSPKQVNTVNSAPNSAQSDTTSDVNGAVVKPAAYTSLVTSESSTPAALVSNVSQPSQTCHPPAADCPSNNKSGE